MQTPVNNMQPYLVLNEVIATTGIYPSRDGVGGTLSGVIGQIHTFASSYFSSASVQDTDGELVTIATNTALFSLLGTYYGGDGKSTFGLPNLDGRVAVSTGQGPGLANHTIGQNFGANALSFLSSQMPTLYGGTSQPFSNVQDSGAVGWYINAFGIYPSNGGGGIYPNTIGMVGAFAGNFAPNGTIPCDGRLLQIADYDVLFTLIGTLYGGDGQTTFAVPDLRGRSIIGQGLGPDGHNYVVGEVVGQESGTVIASNMPGGTGGSSIPVGNMGPGLVMTPVIALSGYFGGFDDQTPGLGEILFFAGNFTPGHSLAAQGQLLPIIQNQALFSLLGTNFGGNGTTNFALPNLAGRVIVGDSAGHAIGEQGGSATFDLTLANLPELTITGDAANNHLAGGDSADVLSGLDGQDLLDGNGGADLLRGGAGKDTLNGDTGDDKMFGGSGDDTFHIDSANDRVYETTTPSSGVDAGGTDSVISSISLNLSSYSGIRFVENLSLTGIADLNGTGNALNNSLTGNSGGNILNGLDGNDTLSGADGNDRLFGQAGDDFLNGGIGTDWLQGGAGRDMLTGGTNADSFVFDDSDFVSPNPDRISDFSHAEGDRIRLNLVDANTANGPADDPFSFIGTGSFTHVAGQLRYQQYPGSPGTGDDITIVQGDTDGNGTGDFAIRLNGLHTLVAGDFAL